MEPLPIDQFPCTHHISNLLEVSLKHHSTLNALRTHNLSIQLEDLHLRNLPVDKRHMILPPFLKTFHRYSWDNYNSYMALPFILRLNKPEIPRIT